eukprot:5668920-Alexandrium_andersonii.AAC.1
MAPLATLWVLREVEAAWAAAADVTLDTVSREAHWRLPVSKTDPRVLARMRTRGVHLQDRRQPLVPIPPPTAAHGLPVAEVRIARGHVATGAAPLPHAGRRGGPQVCSGGLARGD